LCVSIITKFQAVIHTISKIHIAESVSKNIRKDINCK